MTSVLTEQHIATRRHGPRRSSPTRLARVHRERPRRRRSKSGERAGRVGSIIRTALLIVLTIGLAGTLAIILPELESAPTEDDRVVLEATAPALPEIRSGLVELELTEGTEHIVADGETLSGIARRYNVDLGRLATHNDLADPNAIAEGQLIVIPGPVSPWSRGEE